ncbi:lecithin retinol acyltransferase family protein [Luteibacter yeojuensis]|uniref:Lecithin retinol acyltransferase family protein n=1 Tax=Luteibacter yeojuensis TaxID=345309 RepID=A0A7X5QSA8_9GAMM|nr:lecithin retinol acyltransferase family protein [Luteibacter yeojuensis]NID14503.1 lecithin retinol acyltransferase family protein [Luteibacter yeojuensis]
MALGSHLVSPRSAYTHHGIYIGKNRVVHYAGWCDGPRAGAIEEVAIEDFCSGRDFYVKKHATPKYDGTQVIARARSRIGENHYSVWANNCEHFCEWAINDRHHSDQIDKVTGGAGTTFASAAGLAARGVVAASGSVAGLSGAGIMSGLASTGAVVGGGAVAGLGLLGAVPGLAGASLLNNTVLADNPALDKDERESRTVGRAASYAGAVAGTAGSIGAVSALGTAGLSAAGISSGLATIGATVGGGMASGVVIATAAPVAAAAAVGYGAYKLYKWIRD